MRVCYLIFIAVFFFACSDDKQQKKKLKESKIPEIEYLRNHPSTKVKSTDSLFCCIPGYSFSLNKVTETSFSGKLFKPNSKDTLRFSLQDLKDEPKQLEQLAGMALKISSSQNGPGPIMNFKKGEFDILILCSRYFITFKSESLLFDDFIKILKSNFHCS
jgi:hypothetical protein